MWPFQRFKGRRRPLRRGPAWYLQPKWQVTGVLVGALVMASLLFTGALLLNYTQTNDHIVQAKQLMSEGKLAWAAREFEAVVEQNPKAYMAWVYLGQCYLELNDVEKAENAFESAMAIRRNAELKETDPKQLDLVSTVARAKILSLQEKFKEAEVLLTTAYEAHAGNDDLKLALWDVYNQWGKWHLNHDDDPQKALNLFQQARSFVTRYRYDMKLQNAMTEAIEKAYDRLLKDPKSSLEERRGFLLSALEAHYSHALLARLARVESELGHEDNALQTLRQAYTLSPKLYGLRYAKALDVAKRSARKSGDDTAAAQYNDQLAELNEALKAESEQGVSLPYDVTLTLTEFEGELLDERTGEWSPKLAFTVANQEAEETVDLLRMRIRLSSGRKTLFQQYEELKQPLAPKGEMAASQPITVKVENTFTLQQLDEGMLRCEVAVTFEEGNQATWFPLISEEKVLFDPELLKGASFPWETAKEKENKKPASTLPTRAI
jgi:tetratricopeptide (TPR) repeat protein